MTTAEHEEGTDRGHADRGGAPARYSSTGEAHAAAERLQEKVQLAKPVIKNDGGWLT
jgi:hypothetical protein